MASLSTDLVSKTKCVYTVLINMLLFSKSITNKDFGDRNRTNLMPFLHQHNSNLNIVHLLA